MSTKPTLILVPGAWHSIATWSKVVALLQAQDYKCIPVTLPTTSNNNSMTFTDDFNAVREAIISETIQGHDVVVIVHSYGGAVGQSAIKGLTVPKQSDTTPVESKGHVIGLLMIASGFGQTGTTFLGGMGGTPPPIWKLDIPSGSAIITVPVRELFYHDLPEEEGEAWVHELTPQSLKAFTEGEEVSYSGWKDVPVWYLMTTENKALPFEAQKYFAQMARDMGGDATVREIASSHSPMLSKRKETVEFILEALGALKA